MFIKDRVMCIGAVCLAVFIVFAFSPLPIGPTEAAGKPIVLKFAHQNPPKASSADKTPAPSAHAMA